MELLVAISIAGGLAALLLPGMKSIRDSARTLQCQNNLRQMGSSNSSYARDWRGYSVPLCMENDAGNNWRKNVVFSQNYANIDSVNNAPKNLLCPNVASLGLNFFRSYSANKFSSGNFPRWDNGIDQTNGINYYPPVEKGKPITYRIESFANASELVVFLDGSGSFQSNADADPALGYFKSGQPAPENSGIFVYYRHRFRANCVFADGHVSGMDSASLYDPSNNGNNGRYFKRVTGSGSFIPP